MQAEEVINKIQQKIRGIKLVVDSAMSEPDDWLMDEINSIQHIINDYRNAWAKPSEPDPFN